MEEPSRLQSLRSLKVRHDWATSLSLFTSMHWRRKWQPTSVFLPCESQGWGSLVGLLSMGSHRVGHNWNDLAAAAAATSQITNTNSDLIFKPDKPLTSWWYFGEGNGNPLQYSCLENLLDKGAWQATVHGVARVRHNLSTKPNHGDI